MDFLLSLAITILIPVSANSSALGWSANIYTAIGSAIFKNLLGDFHVVFAVLDDFVDLAGLVPLKSLKTIGGFFDTKCRLRDVIESEASSGRLPNILKHIET
jgi:hypothetical protein